MLRLFGLARSLLTFNLSLKKGDRSNPFNYRPIALTSCPSKAFESILNKKIMRHQLTTFSLIASMVSRKADILVILLS